MSVSTTTNYIVNLFAADELVNTIALSASGIIDTKKESIYPLVTIEYNGFEIDRDNALLKDDYTITILQQRDSRKAEQPSKLMEDTNYIDNLNECQSICVNFVNYIDRFELENINIDSLSISEPLSNYGGANLDGFRIDITFSVPNTGFCTTT